MAGMSDQDEPVIIDETGALGDRPLVIPAELPVLPLRDTVLFPELVHAAGGGPRGIGPPD